MLKNLQILRWLVLPMIIAVAIIGNRLYLNIYYLNNKFDVKNIYLENYKNLPQMVESWPGSQKLLSGHNYKNLTGNEKVKKIERNRNRMTVDLYFAEPDKEDNAEKRSATVTYPLDSRANSFVDMTGKVLFSAIETEAILVGQGYRRSRVQFELTDINGKTMMGPKLPLTDIPKGKTYIVLRPTTIEPVPTGSFRDGFDITKVTKITIRFILAVYPEGISQFPLSGKLYFDNIYLISNLEHLEKYFGQASQERVTRDNINLSYQVRKVKWEIEDEAFFVGINYPWNNYGWDIGKNPYGLPENSGWSANDKKLWEELTYLKTAGIEPVRIYLFFDFRTGLEYKDGKLIGFDKYVSKDIETLIRIAGEVGIKIIPVLFDFGIADGQGGSAGGEHPELVFSSDKYYFLTNMMVPLLQDMESWDNQYGNPVFALELMNEPDNMAALIVPGYFQSLKVWFRDLANIIHNETSFKVTLGSHSIVDMQRWWNGIDIDIWQFHFYKYMEHEHDYRPQNLDRKDIKIEGKIFAGEMQPYDIKDNIDIVKKNGYNGLLFWSWNTTDGFGLRGKPAMDEIINWIAADKLKEAN